MNGLLSIIGMKTEMEYQMSDFPFGLPRIRFNVPKGNIPSDKQKCQPTHLSQIGYMIVRNGKMMIFLLKRLNRKNKYRMKKETFDFSEALRRMKEGKKVKRRKWNNIY